MADFVGWIGEVLAINIATVGSVQVTLGLILAGSMIFGFAVSAANKIRSRA